MLRTRRATRSAALESAQRPTSADDSPGDVAADRDAAREAALKLLDRQRYTRSDLARRLRDKDFDAGTIDETLNRLSELGLLDDVEYARAFIAGRWGRRAAGWRKLEQDLRGRGVSGDDIAAARERFAAEAGGATVDETASALRVVRQAARRYASLDPRTRRQRLTALLLRRGFSYETIEQVLRAEES